MTLSESVTMNGIEAALEILAAAGVRHLFGNPGTTELPLNAALSRDSRFRYLFGLHEIPVMSMADGYAMASGHVGVVNVHSACGLGNSMGMLYNAHIEGTPLLITAGQQDRRLIVDEPVIAGDLVSVARPWTKWTAEVSRVQDLPNLLRRAIQTALTPPTGPVFLSLPVDVQLELVEGLDLSPPHVPDRHVRPPIAALERAAELLSHAKNPVILAGSRVAEADAIAELAAVAERLAAPVFSESTPSHGRLPMPCDHPLYAGILPYWSQPLRERLNEFDIALAVGINVFRLYIHQQPDRALPEYLRVIHLDNVPWEIGKNYPVELGLVGDPQAGLSELASLLDAKLDAQRRKLSLQRVEEAAQRRRQERERLQAEIDSQRDTRPMTAKSLMGALARVLPDDVCVVEEAITTHGNVFEKLAALHDPKAFFAHRGWALGWGMGCTLGVKLAWPERPVLGLIGDGAALYGIQALWSAAHHRIPVTFVIANNSQYQILKVCGDMLSLPEIRAAECPGINLTDPAVDYVPLARSFGVEARRVTEPDELSELVRASWENDRPLLFEVPIGD